MSPFTANIAANGGVPAAGHNGSKWLKPAENKFTQNAYTGFSMQVSANLHNFRFRESVLHTYSKLSNRSRRKYFTNFLNLIFGGFLQFGPTVRGFFDQHRAFSFVDPLGRSPSCFSLPACAASLPSLRFARVTRVLSALWSERPTFVQKLSFIFSL